MDYLANKALIIGVGIFVTLMIVTGLILTFTEVSKIYSSVENTDTSIRSKFDNVYSMYSGATLNVVDLLNTLRKYELDENIKVGIGYLGEEEIEFGDSKTELIVSVEEKIDKNIFGYEEQFNVLVREDESNNLYIIFYEIK